MNWDDLRVLRALLAARSLTAAAGLLGTTQPTVGRRLTAIESEYGPLFERSPAGLMPTALALGIADDLDRMEERALAIRRHIDAKTDALEGSISVTSLDWLGDHVVAPITADFAAAHPGVEIELRNEGRLYNLARRDADVAIRFGAFAQENVVQQRLAYAAFGLYAAPAYLERHGAPHFAKGAPGHRLVLLHEEAKDAPYRDWIVALAPDARVILRTNGLQSHAAVVSDGIAMGVLPRLVGDRLENIERISVPVRPPLQPIRIGVHPDLRVSTRIRAFVDFAADAIRQRRPVLDPDG